MYNITIHDILNKGKNVGTLDDISTNTVKGLVREIDKLLGGTQAADWLADSYDYPDWLESGTEDEQAVLDSWAEESNEAINSLIIQARKEIK